MLIVANRTAASPELLAFMEERPDASYELVVPPQTSGPSGRAAAERSLAEALARYAAAGIEDVRGHVATTSDLVVAVIEAYDPSRHDDVVLSTLPAATSRWLAIDGPARVARATGALVHHVVAREPRPEPRIVRRARERELSPGIFAAFEALGYGRPHQRA